MIVSDGSMRVAALSGWIGALTLPTLMVCVVCTWSLVSGSALVLLLLLGVAWPGALWAALTLRPESADVEEVETSGRWWGIHWVREGAAVAWGSNRELAQVRSHVRCVQPERTDEGGYLLSAVEPPQIVFFLAVRIFLMGLLGFELALACLTLALLLVLDGGAALSWVEALSMFSVTSFLFSVLLAVSLASAVAVAHLNAPHPGHDLRLERNRIVIDGRPLLIDPDWVSDASFHTRGARITVGNVEHVEYLYGRLDQLTWLAERLRAMPPPGDRREVPQALKGLSGTSASHG